MKHFLLFFTLLTTSLGTAMAQSAPGPVETKVTENICDCISKLDASKITNKASAEQAFVECFSQQAAHLVALAEERNVQITDQAAMRNLGIDIGKNLLNQNCPGFMPLAVAMAKNEEAGLNSGTTQGTLKRIDTKDFNYFVLTDAENKERSFIWLRQFPGSDSFMGNPNQLKGKKLRIEWREIEVYIPSAKNYYNIKEVVGLEVL